MDDPAAHEDDPGRGKREFQQRARSQELSNQMFKGSRSTAAPPADPPAPAAGAGPARAEATAAVDAIASSAEVLSPPSQVVEGPMGPVWIDSGLFLLRTVSVDHHRLIQGVWLDWPAIRTRLLMEIAAVMPEATPEQRPESITTTSDRLLSVTTTSRTVWRRVSGRAGGRLSRGMWWWVPPAETRIESAITAAASRPYWA